MSSIRETMKLFDKPGDPVLPLSPSGKPMSNSPKSKGKNKLEDSGDGAVHMKLVDKIKMFESGMKYSGVDTAASSAMVESKISSSEESSVKKAIASIAAKEPALPKNSFTEFKQQKEKESIYKLVENGVPPVFSITGFIPTSPRSAPRSPDAVGGAKRNKTSTPLKKAVSPVKFVDSPPRADPERVNKSINATPKQVTLIHVPEPKAEPAEVLQQVLEAVQEPPAPRAAPSVPTSLPSNPPIASKAAPASPPPSAPKAAPASPPPSAPKAAPSVATAQAKQANATNNMDHSATLDKPDFPKPPLFTDDKK